jgi:cell wall-associated NlpC family hydrolase
VRPLVLSAAAAILLTGAALPAVADPGDGDTPSQRQVDQAHDAVVGKKRSVAAVRTDLLLANQRLQDAGVRAAQAGEAYNAARWKLAQAQATVQRADARAERAGASLVRQEERYGELIAATYENGPELTALTAMVDQSGVDGMVDAADATYQLTTAADDIRDAYDAAAELADLATDDAEEACEEAAGLEKEAEKRRAEAEHQESAAAAEAQAVTRQKDELIAELAQLQDISVDLAARRQAALEAAAQAQAAAAAQQELEQLQTPAEQPDPEPAGDAGDAVDAGDSPADPPASDPEPQPHPEPEPDLEPDPEPQPDPTPPAPSTSGAQRAISFARAQLGEPYVWAADGPGSWDCSGLTMRAWEAGGKYLPHYSVGQYDTATPISSSQLRPGDLVFWGSSSSPGSIYHVALYVGDGRIIHAPRTGKPVTEESMYYWIPPNFFARP